MPLQRKTLKKKNQNDYVSRYNLRARENKLEISDQVLVLISSSSHKLMKIWMRPATIVELQRPHTAKINMEDRSLKEWDFNKFWPYVVRNEQIGLIFVQDLRIWMSLLYVLSL